MARLRVLSWNLRTFASHPPHPDDLRRIAQIILQSQADVVCIQEVQIGLGVVGDVDAPISATSLNAIRDLFQILAAADAGANWAGRCTGVNSGCGDYMRDAYAFIWKRLPSKSSSAHTDAPDGIADMAEPVILRQRRHDNFPGRRPGMLAFTVRYGAATTQVNVISYHAPTPVNAFSKGHGAGYGINALATLAEIGGGMQVGTGHSWSYQDKVMPLPRVDTIVLGDFNYSMDQKWAPFTYNNLLTNYQPCVSDPNQIVPTTYSSDPKQALRLISAYDNIFVLRGHSKFTPTLTPYASGCINFIEDESKQLGQLIDIRGFGTHGAWFLVHQDMFKYQHGSRGISDHLPVWAEFTLGGAGTAAGHTRPTSEADNNCLMHAVFGVLDHGWYRDAQAADHRMELVASLRSILAARVIPTGLPGTRYALVREAILRSMINEFSDRAGDVASLRYLLGNPLINPFLGAGFAEAFGTYIDNISHGRMLWVDEAELVASVFNIPITLHYPEPGRAPNTFNPGGVLPPVHIYHYGLHFSRWLP